MAIFTFLALGRFGYYSESCGRQCWYWLVAAPELLGVSEESVVNQGLFPQTGAGGPLRLNFKCWPAVALTQPVLQIPLILLIALVSLVSLTTDSHILARFSAINNMSRWTLYLLEKYHLSKLPSLVLKIDWRISDFWLPLLETFSLGNVWE